MREAAKTRDPSTYRGRPPDSAVLSELRRREWARRTPEEKERHLAAFIAAGQVHNKKSSKTRIETIVRGILSALKVEFEQNVQLGRFNVDFLVEDLIVECQGDFWHCNPAIWVPDQYNASLRMTAREKWEKDGRRRMALEEKGYRFCAFWESEIRNDPDAVRSALKGLLGS
jgi:very-short-patch-repair endonuclease